MSPNYFPVSVCFCFCKFALFFRTGWDTRCPLCGLDALLALSHVSFPCPGLFGTLLIFQGSGFNSSMEPCLPTPVFKDFPFSEPSTSYNPYHSFGSCQGVSNLVNYPYVSVGLISPNNYNLEIRGHTFYIGKLSTKHLAPSRP